MLSDKDDELDRLKGRKADQTANVARSDNLSSPSKTGFQNVPLGIDTIKVPGEKQLNLDYIKNVFLKYLEYLANANEKEALTLEKVLFTVLQANDKDVELIEKARQKN